MSYVNHKTSNPGPNDMYGYAFLTLPNPKTPSNPKGVTIDGNILPMRDIHDLSAGTNTWKEMHGVDLYFLEEAEAERYYAMTQFSSDRGAKTQWPQNWQDWHTWSGGYIYSYWWRDVCGRYDEIGQPTRNGGLGRFYKENFLDISSTSQLPNDIMTWPDGSDIGIHIPNGYPHAGSTCYNYLADVIAPLDQSMMISHLSDFNNDNPLSAQPIRHLYKDLEKLQYYVLNADAQTLSAPTHAYKGQIWPDAWYKVDSGYLNWDISYPDRPRSYLVRDIINQQSDAFGNPTYKGMYEIYEVDDGQYKIPYCGKTANGYNPIYGSEVAVYVCLYLTWKTPHYGWHDEKYGFFKMSEYTINRNAGYISLDTQELVRAGYRLVNKYNAEIPRQVPPTNEDSYSTYVRLEKIYLICKLTDRTDTTQLNWGRRPQ